MRVLTKSKFILGLECPNKLFYTNKKEYANSKKENSFLDALAQGGFQVEELARLDFPNGILINEAAWEYEKAWEHTQSLLNMEKVILFEGAFLFEDLFVRADIIIKDGESIELIEVKSKSFDPEDDYLFIGKRGGMASAWKQYLFDVAFQKHVIQSCFPNWSIESYIMMADKTKVAQIDGLNQLFRITNYSTNRTGVIKKIDSIKEIGASILSRKKITQIVRDIESNKFSYHPNLSFQESIELFKNLYKNDEYANWPTGFSSCKKCEFKCSEEDEQLGLKSGFNECFERQHDWSMNDFKRPNIFDIYDFRKGPKLFTNNVLFKDQLSQEEIGYKEESNRLTTSHRQWIQIKKELDADHSIYVNKQMLKSEFEKFVFPLHFIDFETSTAALPFNKGRKPYEQVAFQFSHHIYYENGSIEHANEYISNKSGVFPNFEFIRNLRVALSEDSGTIFRFHNHENIILNVIHNQLIESNEKDKKQLIDFIRSISHSTSKNANKWSGERDMSDLWLIAKNFYYNPITKGSNSLKDLLPAALKASTFLKSKYSKPLNEILVSSKNFPKTHIWLKIQNDEVINPYKSLPPVFDNWTETEIQNSISEITDINDGGAALTAYGKLQYTDMEQTEVDEITSALLKYCELDTLAMVMLYEHFGELIS